MGIWRDFRGFRGAVVEFLRKYGAVRVRVRLGGARFVFCGWRFVIPSFSAVQSALSFSVGYTFTFG